VLAKKALIKIVKNGQTKKWLALLLYLADNKSATNITYQLNSD